jgi:hypothetical protein
MEYATFNGRLNLTIAKAGGVFNLRGATVSEIDLPEASARELILENLRWLCITAPVNPRTGPKTSSGPVSWALSNPISPPGDVRYSRRQKAAAGPSQRPL